MTSQKVTVLLFASAREAVGKAKLNLDVSATVPELGVRASDVLRQLVEMYPRLDFEGSQISVAVNQSYLGEDDVAIRAGDEVALLPPIAGG